VTSPPPASRLQRWTTATVWLAAAGPGLYQLALLLYAVSQRYLYPYDLEWMEGGLLHHALRLGDGDGIYVAPSVDFIPYLYTPLYPSLLAALGKVLGLSYQLGRAVSLLALVGLTVVAVRSLSGKQLQPARPTLGWVSATLAMGLFAAAYPFVEGWYDLVRADTLFLLMVTAGIWRCSQVSFDEDGWRGDAPAALTGLLLGLSFFCKQTGVLYAIWGGMILGALAVGYWIRGRSWERARRGGRRFAVYTAVVATLGLGGTALLQRATGGWFWTYIYEIHQAHDFNMPRFWRSFGNILWHFPAATVLTVGALVVVAITAALTRRLPPSARPLLLWSFTYGLSTLVGAVGWGTEFAHFNAYMPALLHGALAAGASILAVAGCAAALTARWPRVSPAISAGAGLLAAVILGAALIKAPWKPRRFVPTAADQRAGDALIKRIAAVDGEVWVPSHPWYGHLAGKSMFVHRMGVKDVTSRRPRPVRGLDEAVSTHRFAAIFLDGRDLHHDSGLIARHYRPEFLLPAGERPRTFTGAPVMPEAMWVPATKAVLPAGTRVLFDFESGRFDGWRSEGVAWGRAPVDRERTGQGPVTGWAGRYFATSMNGGDVATGKLTSPRFVIDGSRLSLRLSGGTDDKLRVELRAGTATLRVARNDHVASERFRVIEWDVSELRGVEVELVAIDDTTGSWGHLNLDEIWISE
jgi:hypothetical protein